MRPRLGSRPPIWRSRGSVPPSCGSTSSSRRSVWCPNHCRLPRDGWHEKLRSGGWAASTVVFTNGVFDILHAGHVDFLREARRLGDVLVVAVNTDVSARRLKGRNRPINSERDRASLVAALDCVDHVVLFDEDEPSDLIRLLRPDVHVKGGDYRGQDLPEAQAVADVGGRVEDSGTVRRAKHNRGY